MEIEFKYLVSSIWHRENGHFQVIETALNAQGEALAHLACEYEERDWINHDVVYVLCPHTTAKLGEYEGYIGGYDALHRAKEWVPWHLGHKTAKPAPQPAYRPKKRSISHNSHAPSDLSIFDGHQKESAHDFAGFEPPRDTRSEIFNSMSE